MSDSESNVERRKEKETPENPQLQSSEPVDEVFSLFKGYLNTQLEAQGNLIEDQSEIERSASEFKFKGNRKQFEVNAKLENLSRIKTSADDPAQVHSLSQEAQQIIQKRQKIIKIADRSKDRWLVAQEYESDDIASNSEDENRLRKAKNAADKKRKDSDKSKPGTSTRIKSDGDNQLFRGKIFSFLCFIWLFLMRLECLSIQPSNSVGCFECIACKRKVIYVSLSRAN